jgi:hypothetical protein
VQADSLQQALREFSATLTANFAVAVANPAQAEDQLKGPMQTLLKRAGAAFGLDTVARTEATTVQGVRPDVGVSVDGLLAGHVELKAPGKGATPKEFADPHDKEQFKRLADHPNLVYSDGNEWALYRRGTLVGKVVRADGDVRTDGAATYGASSSSALAGLLRDFLLWEPIVPSNPKALAEALAPLTRLLREAVRLSLAEPASALSHLAEDWREFFFPQADDAQFADAYAQTLTYALLLARVEGETDLRAHAADRLDDRHALLAQVLRVLAEPAARQEVEAPVGLLERAIAAVDPTELVKRAQDRDVWLYSYEDFLAVYDPKLRKQRGVYFTPPPVVEAQIALVSELLRDRFGKELGFAHDDVVVLDPAVGTGTYLLAAMNEGLDRVSGDLRSRCCGQSRQSDRRELPRVRASHRLVRGGAPAFRSASAPGRGPASSRRDAHLPDRHAGESVPRSARLRACAAVPGEARRGERARASGEGRGAGARLSGQPAVLPPSDRGRRGGG